MQPETITKILTILKKHYTTDWFGVAHHKDPFKVLIACIMSLRTRDEVTYPRAAALFQLAETPTKMLKLLEETIAQTIYPVGFYRTKAKTILGICQKLMNEYQGKVPDTIEELLTFHGVGRKTANIVITFGYGKDGIAVDTHVHRITNRLGWVNTRTPHETEFALRTCVPREQWQNINELMVRHGQSICKPLSPLCSKCMIRVYCPRKGVLRSR
ncbi:endonuclease III [Candidatus Woesearchaeota archaeon]|nr:endonuclease III [Candidatus Woesearchaeota archaeon]